MSLNEFFRQKKWQKLKKTDWIAIALTGVLLLIIALPAGNTLSGEKNKSNPAKESANETSVETKERNDASNGSNDTDTYEKMLEEKLETLLSCMDGVGKVKVMVTLNDRGESVLEKDEISSKDNVTETDSSGGSRTTVSEEKQEAAVFTESDGEKIPYVKKETLPSIEGVVVVAQGGDNPTVQAEISDAVCALFSIEPHKIKVVKMCSKGEES